MVETRSGKRLQVDLPPRRVFEDLEPRLVDVDDNSRDEIMVVESDSKFLGASLALFRHRRRPTQTDCGHLSFLGQPYRWLNPLGVGDYDGDGKLDIALVATPHIGGKLRLYRFTKLKPVPVR